jgi:hypothetical protein
MEFDPITKINPGNLDPRFRGDDWLPRGDDWLPRGDD